MKEFVYTCEHCGAEYNITEPGQYQCQNCNNVFTVEDQERKQAEHLEQIRAKAKAEAGTDHKPKKYRWDVGFYALLGISCIFSVVTCCSVVLSVMEIIATQKKNTENIYRITEELRKDKIEEMRIIALLSVYALSAQRENEQKIAEALKTFESEINIAIEEHKKAEKILQDFREQNQYFLKKSAYEHKMTIISAILFLLSSVATCFFRLWQKMEYWRRCKIG